jgi:DNA polymerase
MATRDDILTELGLTPRWQLREQPMVESVATSLVAEAHAPPADETVASASIATDDPGARRERIAALTWDALAPDIAQCVACGLCKSRHKTVPGVGDRNADWMFIGEAPGAEEDARGEPFVGQAGRLLDSMLAALGMSRTRSVYIANVLKCRPPNNRTPEPGEAEACRPYLERQIELIRPKLIVALGKSAASLLLGTDATIASLRGRIHRYQGVPLIVTYHPAYLLRNLTDKAKAWEDLVLARTTVAQSGDDGRVLASSIT